MVPPPEMPGQDEVWHMGPAGTYDATSGPPPGTGAAAPGPVAARDTGLGGTYAPMSYAPPRTLKEKRRRLTVKDLYPYHKQQHLRKLSAKTPVADLKKFRPKIRSLIEHTVGGGEGYEMFAHKKRQLSYREAIKTQGLQRRLQSHRYVRVYKHVKLCG